jgi:intracellular sulfur oxidation DsrE/DsrF family protein
MRRTFLKSLLASLPLAALGTLGAGRQALAADTVKVVYHFADGTAQATRGLANIRNHLRAEPQAKIVVVALADGIGFLLADARDRNGKPFDAQVAALAAQGVEFRVCNNTLQAHDVPASRLLPQTTLVPSGVAEVARLQAQEGFVYLRP